MATSENPLWKRHESKRPAARLGLTADQVIRAGIELADEKGLEALSMAKLARRLGFAPMALYRHVPNRYWLLELMANDAVGLPPDALGAASDGWRPALERWSWALLTVLRRHPWVMQILTTGLPVRPSQLAWLDRGLLALDGTRLTEHEKAELLLVLNGLIFWEARLAADFEVPEAAEADHVAQALDAVAAEEFPSLRRALDAGIFAEPSTDRDADFQFGLGVILDGIGRQIEDAESRPG